MPKTLALLWASLGVIWLISISAALSFRSPWLALLFAVLFVLHTGTGFIVKAKIRRKQSKL